jgi:hypothetical protein
MVRLRRVQRPNGSSQLEYSRKRVPAAVACTTCCRFNFRPHVLKVDDRQYAVCPPYNSAGEEDKLMGNHTLCRLEGFGVLQALTF